MLIVAPEHRQDQNSQEVRAASLKSESGCQPLQQPAPTAAHGVAGVAVQMPCLPTLCEGGCDIVVEPVSDHQGRRIRNAAEARAGGEEAEDVRVGFAESVFERPEAEARGDMTARIFM